MPNVPNLMTHSFFPRGKTLNTIRDSVRKVKYKSLTGNIRNKIIIVTLFLKSCLYLPTVTL